MADRLPGSSSIALSQAHWQSKIGIATTKTKLIHAAVLSELNWGDPPSQAVAA